MEVAGNNYSSWVCHKTIILWRTTPSTPSAKFSATGVQSYGGKYLTPHLAHPGSYFSAIRSPSYGGNLGWNSPEDTPLASNSYMFRHRSTILWRQVPDISPCTPRLIFFRYSITFLWRASPQSSSARLPVVFQVLKFPPNEYNLMEAST